MRDSQVAELLAIRDRLLLGHPANQLPHRPIAESAGEGDRFRVLSPCRFPQQGASQQRAGSAECELDSLAGGAGFRHKLAHGLFLTPRVAQRGGHRGLDAMHAASGVEQRCPADEIRCQACGHRGEGLRMVRELTGSLQPYLGQGKPLRPAFDAGEPVRCPREPRSPEAHRGEGRGLEPGAQQRAIHSDARAEPLPQLLKKPGGSLRREPDPRHPRSGQLLRELAQRSKPRCWILTEGLSEGRLDIRPGSDATPREGLRRVLGDLAKGLAFLQGKLEVARAGEQTEQEGGHPVLVAQPGRGRRQRVGEDGAGVFRLQVLANASARHLRAVLSLQVWSRQAEIEDRHPPARVDQEVLLVHVSVHHPV